MYLKLLNHHIKKGMINLVLPSGGTYQFGGEGVKADWIIKTESAIRRIAKNWEYELGETYIEGGWTVPNGKLQELLYVLRDNYNDSDVAKWMRPILTVLQQWNRLSKSRHNVSHHYDLDADFFRLFLDREMHYSCAYFQHDDVSLEQAQEAKCRHIAKKLLLKPGQEILDVGCGWGSFAIYLAENFDVNVVGITLSSTQLEEAKKRARARGLKNVRFELCDYRDVRGKYDRIVSIGMFEHVGKPYFGTYFQTIKALLKRRGVALIHTIGRSGPPSLTNSWVRKYIFPGGYIPSMSEATAHIETAGMMLADVEVLRLHYAQTLHFWFQRFQQHRQVVLAQRGEKFCRMWEFYLAISEISFRCSDLVVFQLQLAQEHSVVPPIRDYLYNNNVAEYYLDDGHMGVERTQARS